MGPAHRRPPEGSDPETGSESLTGPRFLSGKRKVLERVVVMAAHSVTA